MSDPVDAAWEQGLPHEVRDVPEEDDTGCGPTEEELDALLALLNIEGLPDDWVGGWTWRRCAPDDDGRAPRVALGCWAWRKRDGLRHASLLTGKVSARGAFDLRGAMIDWIVAREIKEAEESLHVQMPAWRRALVREYGLASVLRTDERDAAKARAECEAERQRRQREITS